MSTHRTQKTELESMPLQTVRLSRLSAVLWWTTPAFLVLLSFSLMVIHKISPLPVERLRASISDFTSPTLSALSAPIGTAVDSIGVVASFRDLHAENIQLRNENVQLRQWYEAALRMQAENKSLRELLNVKADPSMSFVTARVISDAGGSFVKSVLLPAGKMEGVRKGSAVMSGHGLVGRVMETGDHAARVLLISDLNSRIPVVVQNTRIKAILAGKNKELLRLERLPPDSGMTVGARVITSGDGGQLPADLPIGEIVSSDANGVWVKPLSDITRMTYVQVINTGSIADLDDSTFGER